MDKGYFSLTSPIDRRLYELARKHCGDQAMWKVNIDLLMEKLGVKATRAQFRALFRQRILADLLPEYRMALDSKAKPDDAVFYTRNSGKLAKHLIATSLSAWFSSIERTDINQPAQPAITDV